MDTPQKEVKPPGQPHWRQLDIVNPRDLQVPIFVIGAGAIGSLSTLVLAKMGAEQITVMDFDTVEDHNWPNQYYPPAHIGRPKVESLAELVEFQTGVRITPRNERYVDQKLSGIVIAAVDSMKVRKDIWFKGVRLKPAVKFFIDARMGGLTGRIYPVKPIDPSEMRFYEENLYDDDQSTEAPCTARAIIDNVAVIDGIVAGLVRTYVTKGRLPQEIILDLKNFSMQSSYRK